MRPGTPIVLIGFMATGKTTVGRLVAERLNRRFLDLDHLVEERAGMKIPDLFRTQGEPAFRKVEAEALQALGHQLADGGLAGCHEADQHDGLSRRHRIIGPGRGPGWRCAE